MDAVELYRWVKDELSIDDTAAAVLVLAQVISGKRLLLEDGEAIAHGIYLGLKPLLGEEINVNLAGGIETNQGRA